MEINKQKTNIGVCNFAAQTFNKKKKTKNASLWRIPVSHKYYFIYYCKGLVNEEGFKQITKIWFNLINTIRENVQKTAKSKTFAERTLPTAELILYTSSFLLHTSYPAPHFTLHTILTSPFPSVANARNDRHSFPLCSNERQRGPIRSTCRSRSFTYLLINNVQKAAKSKTFAELGTLR
ncbi:hypothetical protein SAMN02927921_04256 [Sinomicrobium oceani]|uniref:Uncharacterized protein n=1 Tax=Sinomicrobium oceani TaxID=1150368 RepID=A0A1K1S039_9FLAO|nr:hypothetical protein SAMN02927921_04256 [Sinomicrobium oceani]